MYLSPRARRGAESIGEFTQVVCGWPTSYQLSQSFLARPELWTPEATNTPSALHKAWFQPVFQRDVLFPSRKVFVWDWEMPFLSRPVKRSNGELDEPAPTLFADSHVAEKTQTKGTRPIVTTFASTKYQVQRWHNTIDGVRGFDE